MFFYRSERGECLLLVCQNVTEARQTLLEVDNRLVGILHRTELDPWVNVLVNAELEHLGNLLGAANGRACKSATSQDEREGADGDGLLGSANLDEGAVEC